MDDSAPCFISYRRTAGGDARLLWDRLAARFGDTQIFLDTESVDYGENFPSKIAQAIQAASVVLVMVGPDWLDSLVRNQREGKTDWVRIEIAQALERQARGESVAIIPLLVGGAAMPDVKRLPAEVSEIAGFFALNALKLGEAEYERAGPFARLVGRLEESGMQQVRDQPPQLPAQPARPTQDSKGTMGPARLVSARVAKPKQGMRWQSAVLAVLSIALAVFLTGPTALAVTGGLCATLWFWRRRCLPPSCATNDFRASLFLLCIGATSSYGFWAARIDAAFWASAAGREVPSLVPRIAWAQFDGAPSTLLLLALVGIFILASRLLGDRSIGGFHGVSINEIFPETSFDAELAKFCKTLRDQIRKVDAETNWNPENYAELEAEVEIVNDVGMTLRRKSSDMQSAIRSDRKTPAFLVLGDPGAGKSVALRKLASDMLAEAGKTQRVPIYVNLREWLPEDGRRKRWSEQNKPTMAELKSFVISSITQGDEFMEKFVARYFDDLREHGFLFFIFDSFDEIPQLLDADGESWLIESLSDLLYRFIISAHRARGVLASRFFRRPTEAFLAQRILSVKPLTEGRILRALGRVPGFGKEKLKELFRDRPDLVPIASNPFLMSLLSKWMQHKGVFPSTQAELYDGFLRRCLMPREDLQKRDGISLDDIFDCATDIAWFMFKSPGYGLEALEQDIRRAVSNKNVNAVMKLLRDARLARGGVGKPFAFVHRRFLEYFVTKRLLDCPVEAPLDHIPTDSRGRDALVLYAQLCDDESAGKLAALCWEEIETHFGEKSTRLRAVHCLRFLIDAFRARREVIEPFADEFGAFINRHVREGENLVLAKICLECTGLFTGQDALPTMDLAMRSNNYWLQQTSFRACRHLPNLSSELIESIQCYIIWMPLSRFFSNFGSLMFSTSLSDSMRGVRSVLILRCFHLCIAAVAIFVVACCSPTELFDIVMIYFAICLLFGDFSQWGDEPNQILKERFLRFLPSVGFFLCVTGFWMTYSSLEKFSSKFHYMTRDSSLFLQGKFHGFDFFEHNVSHLMTAVAAVFIVDWIFFMIVIKAICRMAEIFFTGVPLIDFFVKLLFDFVYFVVGSAVLVFLFVGVCMALEFLGGLLLQAIPQDMVIFLTVTSDMKRKFGVTFDVVIAVGFAILMCAPIVIIVFGKIQSRLQLSEIRMSSLDRNRIAEIYISIKSTKGKLKFVRTLAERRITAFGEWPPNFHLEVSGDPAITELAMLEEKWLKLDR